jgi:hypothetical protein
MSSPIETLRETLGTTPAEATRQAATGIDPWAVIQGALAGWAGMTAIGLAGRGVGMGHIDMMELEGTFFAPPRGPKAVSIGFFTHLGMSLWIAFVYAAGFKLLRLRPDWRSGAFGSLIHWLIASGVVGWWSRTNPHRRQIAVPGFGGFAQGSMGAIAFFVAHLVYGALLGWRYGGCMRRIR